MDPRSPFKCSIISHTEVSSAWNAIASEYTVPYESAASTLSEFSSHVWTNQRQSKYENTTNLLIIKSGNKWKQLIYTVVQKPVWRIS